MNRALSSRAILVAAILAICTIVGAQATREPAAQAAATKPTQVIVVRVEELRQLRADSKRAARLEDEVRVLREKLVKLQVVVETLRTVNDKLRASRKRAAATKPVSDRWRGTFSGRREPGSPPIVDEKWAGFRGIKWGTNLAGLPEMSLMRGKQDGDTKVYLRKGDEFTIGAAKLRNITYYSYKGRFYSVVVYADGSSNWRALKAAVFAKYGKGRQPNQFIERWLWGAVHGVGVLDVVISLGYNEFSEESDLLIAYRPIVAEEEADDARKAKEAKKDF